MSKKIRVDQPKPPISTPILATAIVRLGEAARALHDSGLNERALIVLLHDKTKISKRDILTILNGMRQLRAWYCK